MIGKYVRATTGGMRPVFGIIIGESRQGTCWVITRPGRKSEEWNKAHCTVISADKVSKGVREWKHKRQSKAGMGRVYGDGEI